MQRSKVLKNGFLALAMAALTLPAFAADNASLRSSIEQKLRSKEFAQVTVAANEKGIVTLAGAVEKYQAKLNAEKKAKKTAGVKEVDNQIQVAGKTISDADLERKLNTNLAYDRAGYGNVYDAIEATVRNGVVTLNGAVRTNPSKYSALALVANQPGVKDVVDNIKVLRVSNYDDQIRAGVVRAIYGNSTLSRYALDSAAPIRVIVDGGKVSLYGTVNTELEKTLAGMRARGVPGAFQVENNLVVARG